jgi:hypothetical protein
MTFKTALKNFTFDMAAGGAVRHMFDSGMDFAQITHRLDFPVPESAVTEEIWRYLKETKTVTEEGEDTKPYEIIKETGPYGRTSFRRVPVASASDNTEYVTVSFGKMKYKDLKGFEAGLSGLSQADRDYCLKLPWPLKDVKHLKNERIVRILEVLSVH